MLSELKGAALLKGSSGNSARGHGPAGLGGVPDRSTRRGTRWGLDTLEVNPLRVDGECVEVLDALALWRNEGDPK